MSNEEQSLETPPPGAPSFRLDDVFPNIERIIREETSAEGDFIPHGDLAADLLSDWLCRALIDSASQTNGKTAEWNASNMLAWFSHWYTRGQKVNAETIKRQKIAGTWAYRSTSSTFQMKPDADAAWVYTSNEGAPIRVLHLRRERDPKLAKQKRQEILESTGELACEVCGFVAAIKFPDIDADLVEVHHCTPLAASKKATIVTTADLALLCPTCHRAIHRSDCMPVDEFRKRYFTNP